MSDFYTNNNEALSSIILLEFFNNCEHITIEKFVLLLPLILDEKISELIKNNGVKNIVNEEIIIKNSKIFIGFDKWFKNMLPISTNSFHILNTMGYINLKNGIIKRSDNYQVSISEFNSFDEKIKRIIEKVPFIVKWIEGIDSNILYNNLNIKL